MSELRTNRIVPRDGLTSGTFNGGGVVQVRHSAFTGIDDTTGGINTALTDFESTYNCTITPTRSDSKILVEMYVNCHKDFLEGKKKFEAVLNRIGINTQLARLKQLTEEQRKMQMELKKNFT